MNEGITEYYPLAKDVLAVAVEGAVGDWCAYVGAVKGLDHEAEQNLVAKTGAKMRRDVAKLLFPEWAKAYKWRK